MASPKGMQLTPEEQEDAAEAIEIALRKHVRTDAKVAAWHAAQIAKAGTVTRGLYLERAEAGIDSLASALGVPDWVFHDLEDQFSYYDFSGDGALQMGETRKLVKHLLRQRLQALTDNEQSLDEVPFAQPHEKGYSVVRELGSGGQGTAYEACNARGQKVMLKFFDKANGNASLGDVLEELATMKLIRYKRLAKVLEVFQDGKYVYLAGEIYTGGDWSKLGANVYYAGVNMSESWWRKIFKQALKGLGYLHEQAQMHCDIKEPNIMFVNKRYEQPQVVLIDFGLSRGFSEEQETVCGSPGYVPPETWQNGRWHPLGDVFSMGIVMFQLVTGGVPSEKVPAVFTEGARNIDQVAEFTINRPMPWTKFPSSFPRLRDLVNQMTLKDLWLRPRVQQVLQHDWFTATSDAPLPSKNLGALVSSSQESILKKKMMEDLEEQNTLYDLRYIRSQLAHFAQNGKVDRNTFVSVLVNRGVDSEHAVDYAGLFADQGGVPYGNLIEEAMKLKKDGCTQTLYELFSEVAVDDYISVPEAHALLMNKEAFSSLEEDDVDAIVGDMSRTGDDISWEEFSWAILKDGRMLRRASCPEDLEAPSYCRSLLDTLCTR